jgi:putative endonuclease
MKDFNTKKLGTVGKFGEDAAVQLLVEKGYEIIGRNIVCDNNEIDIIARDMKYIVFVEVKTRTAYNGLSRFGSAASAVDKNKQERIYAGAKSFLKGNPQRRVPRYDVIEVYVEQTDNYIKVQRINHIPKAFGGGR